MTEAMIFDPPIQPQKADCSQCAQAVLIYPDMVANDCGVDIGTPVEHECLEHKLFMDFEHGLIQTTYGPRIKEIMEYGYDIGLCDYEIYDEKFRPVLNQRILDHFYMREIGAETIELFIFYLNRTMRENMPVFNPIFKMLADPNFNPLENIDVTSEQKQNATGTSRSEGLNEETSTANSENTNDSQALSSNAPQVNISKADLDGYFNAGTFSEGTAESTTTASSTATTGSDSRFASLSGYVVNAHGRQGIMGYQAMREYLDAYVNPLNELFDTLEPCFSQYWTDHMNGF